VDVAAGDDIGDSRALVEDRLEGARQGGVDLHDLLKLIEDQPDGVGARGLGEQPAGVLHGA